MRLLYLFAACLVLSGCATSTTMYGPDGKEIAAIECNGTLLSPSACFKKASEVCGARGYQVLGKDGEAIPTGTGYAQANHYSAMAIQQTGAVVYRTLYVRCGQ